MAGYEVKIQIRSDLSEPDKRFIESKIKEISEKFHMSAHEDGITYSKKILKIYWKKYLTDLNFIGP